MQTPPDYRGEGDRNRGRPMPFPAFDRSRLRIRPLADTRHDLDLSAILPPDAPPPDSTHPALPTLARRLVEARERGAARVVLMGRTSSAPASSATSST